MKLRFEVDQAECFRRGIDCPKSIVTVDVNPADLPKDVREPIADRLSGIDVCHLTLAPNGSVEIAKNDDGTPRRILALEPTFEALLFEVQECQAWIKMRLEEKKKMDKRLAEVTEADIDAIL
jgi:hypothetical protein